ncbi:hypothetical protein NBRC116592_03800 [Colwellia sp. KU-HH00111]|uniref:SUMF1/EgtB/PvdO family nonheme iron enzyme n=1 Tax=Colwellia sp. KU-HH00111 TaxID=3127652 RepID=UPI003108FF1B
MKNIVILATLYLLFFSIASHAQSSKNNQAKAYFFAAQEAFESQQYDDALIAIAKVESLLGKSNAMLSALKVKTYVEQKKFIEAKAEIDVFFGFKARDELAREVSSYLIKVDKIIDAQKQREQVRANRLAREKAARIAKERAERIAREKPKRIIEELSSFKAYTGELVVIPSGSFQMGCVSRIDCQSNEKPVHTVQLSSFVMMATEVTFEQWDACVTDGGCSYNPRDQGWGRGDYPVIFVSYDDITEQFIPWLNKVARTKGGSKFKLPSEEQWEYAARAGSQTKYSWGDDINCSQAKYGSLDGGCGNASQTVPVKSYLPNNFGLYDMHGNVWEWTDDCPHGYEYGSRDKRSKWSGSNCSGSRIVRGGSWGEDKSKLRSAFRRDFSSDLHYFFFGFRLVLEV